MKLPAWINTATAALAAAVLPACDGFNLQDIRPGEENEREADRQALQAAPAATEDDVLRAYQAEIESGRDDRL